ncbi:hypothetical protein O1611_g1600 [Lasiodiplodia mahajangana]|uniref:Uncharacterized protein n=1 Tax=Lasiodiplodia mahajangana TaxID=1108764 RepID=A0ACC2JWW9_9PEZI|nr:hypothetical protein O1611_g1600 [Lasiodiplodia mahajangana]
MDELMSQLKSLASGADRTARRQLMLALRSLANSLEEPIDTTHRFGLSNLQSAIVKVGFDISLFKLLVSSEVAVTASIIAEKTGADSVLLARILRYLASIGVVDEVGDLEFAANHVTRNLAEKISEYGISHCFETISPQYQAIPEFLKKTRYQNPTDPLRTPLQDAFHTRLHAYDWLAQQPARQQTFNDYMSLRRKPEASWLSVYPVREQLTGEIWAGEHNVTRAVYVNISRGIGHQCAEFKSKYPDLPGRVVLQDLAHNLAKALPTPGVENMAHDFFDEQPVKGAKFYFVRRALHNQTDKDAKRLLTRIKDAMAADSVLLIDELVLGERGLDYYSAAVDLTMMSATASMERTETQWREILEAVGLRLIKCYSYNPGTFESVIDARLPSHKSPPFGLDMLWS